MLASCQNIYRDPETTVWATSQKILNNSMIQAFDMANTRVRTKNKRLLVQISTKACFCAVHLLIDFQGHFKYLFSKEVLKPKTELEDYHH